MKKVCMKKIKKDYLCKWAMGNFEREGKKERGRERWWQGWLGIRVFDNEINQIYRRLLLTETHGFFYSQGQFSHKRFVGLVWRHINAIEATRWLISSIWQSNNINLPCMSLWKLGHLTSLFDSEASRTIAALQILESIDRNTRCSCSKLEETRLFLCVPSFDNLGTKLVSKRRC